MRGLFGGVVMDDQPHTLGMQSFCNDRPDTLRAAGNQGHFVCQIVGVILHSVALVLILTTAYPKIPPCRMIFMKPNRALPVPDAQAAAHSARVAALIHGEMAACGGQISFARYMELALHAPGLGYYSAGAHKFGAAGDFVTAPELSALFSRCLARQCQQVLRVLDKANIIEVGGGSGRMACDVLSELEVLNCLPERYFILELSADLRARQRATLEQHIPHLLGRIEWLEGLPPPGFRGVILANELLDAMPR